LGEFICPGIFSVTQLARVNIDGKVWKDPRVKRLAKRCGMSVREAVGTLAAVWDVAYDSKSEIMSMIDVDTAAETEGFAKHMLADDVALAELHEGKLRLCGVRERILYLIAQKERGRKGGISRAEAQANAKQTLGVGLASSKHSPGLPLDLALALDLDKKHLGNTHEVQPGEPHQEPSATPEPQTEPVVERVLSLVVAEAGGRASMAPLSVTTQAKILHAVRQLSAGTSDEDWRNVGRWIKSWSPGMSAVTPAYFAKDGNLQRAITAARSMGGTTTTSGTIAPSDRWLEIRNLAAEESRLEADGKPIPWLSDSRRQAMTHDAAGRALRPVPSRKGQ
jgi:hypothetical protein